MTRTHPTATRNKTLPDFRSDFASIADFLAWWLVNPVLTEPHASIFNGYYRGYRNRFGPHIRHHYADQSREITALISSMNRPRILEVGGGCGTEALWFALLGGRVLAVDINEERLGVARARQSIVENAIGEPLDLKFRCWSVFDLPWQPTFDLIWMEQAFHHVEPREEVYPTIAGLLAPGGHVVISEANGWNPLLQLQLFRRRGFKTIVDHTTSDGRRAVYGNERITVPSVLARGFAEAGVQSKSVRYFRVLPNMSMADALLPMETRVPQQAVPLFSHYNFVGRKG